MNRSTLARSRSPRWKAAVVGGTLAGAVVLGGGVALADGGSANSPSASVPGAPGVGGDVPTPPLSPGDGPGDGPVPGPVPGPPAQGTAPAPPAGAHLPGDGRGRGAPGDRVVGAVAAVSDTTLTVTDDLGSDHDLTLSGDTRVGGGPGENGSLDDLADGDRVEVRVVDGAAVEVHEVLAHVDGVVTELDGTDLTVVTTPGLHVRVDAAALTELPAEGDDVHLRGTVTDDGATVVATEATDGPR